MSGNMIAITDDTGAVAAKFSYTPFGEVINSTINQATCDIPIGFAGAFGVLREPNGLYYMNARYYDPSMGRFLSEDPAGLGGGDLTLYSYAGNNPVVFVDPSGLCRVSTGSQFNSEMVWSGVKDVAFGGLQVGAGAFLMSTALVQEATPTGITQVNGAATGTVGAWYFVNGVGSIGLEAGKISLGLQNPNAKLQNLPGLPPILELLFSPGCDCFKLPSYKFPNYSS